MSIPRKRINTSSMRTIAQLQIELKATKLPTRNSGRINAREVKPTGKGTILSTRNHRPALSCFLQHLLPLIFTHEKYRNCREGPEARGQDLEGAPTISITLSSKDLYKPSPADPLLRYSALNMNQARSLTEIQER